MNTRRAAGMAIAAAGAMASGGGAPDGEGVDGAGQAPKRKTPLGLLIGLGAVVLLVLALLAFFLLWDFGGGGAGGEAPDTEAVPAATTGETGRDPPVSDPSSSGA